MPTKWVGSIFKNCRISSLLLAQKKQMNFNNRRKKITNRCKAGRIKTCFFSATALCLGWLGEQTDKKILNLL